MPAILRNNGPRGPKFYMDGDRLMFLNVLDSATYDGPRLATTADGKTYPEALDAYMSGLEPKQRPMVTFETPEGAEIEPAPKARGSKAPV